MACGQAWYAVPEWWAVVIAAATASGGLTAWLTQRGYARRAALPIIRANWTEGASGCTCRIDIVNRLNEDLQIDAAKLAGELVARHTRYDTAQGKPVVVGETPYPRTMPLDVSVPATGSGWFTLHARCPASDAMRSLKIRVSSSHRTLRRKWIKVATDQPTKEPTSIPIAISATRGA